ILAQEVHYCVMLPPGYAAATVGHPSRRYPVLYFLHGLGENQQTLFKTGGCRARFLISWSSPPREKAASTSIPPTGACAIAISLCASSFPTSRRIIPYTKNERLGPSAAYPWEDMARFVSPLPIQNYFLRSAPRARPSSQNRRGKSMQ